MPLYNLIPVSSDSVEPLLKPSTIFIANYQTDFADLKGHAYTSVGSPVITADKSPYSGGSSLYLPGSSYIQYSPNADFKLNADWEIQTFAWIPSTYASNNTYAGLIDIAANLTVRIALYRSAANNDGLFKQTYAQINSASQSIVTTIFSADATVFDTWNHYSLVKLGSTLYYFLNGVLQSAAILTGTPFFTSNPTITIGSNSNFSPIVGAYIAGVRIRSASVKVPTFPFME